MAPDRSETTDRPKITVAVEQADITKIASDLVVVGAFEGVEKFHGVTGAIDTATGGLLTRALAAGDFKGKFKEQHLVHPHQGLAKRVLLVGLGEVARFTPDRLRRVSAVVARRARDLGVESYHSALHGVGSPGCDMNALTAGEAMAEGSLLGLYTFPFYRGKKDDEDDAAKKPKLARVVLIDKRVPAVRAAAKGIEAGTIIAEATNMCRDWAMLSSDEAAPERYGDRAKALARPYHLKVDVLDKARIENLGMGGLLAVNRGSAREPRFITVEHAPPGAKRTVVLVGKGITFDSGGISIKPSDGMENMKMDKCGASAVVAAVVAAARMKLPLRVIAITAWTENLPSGSSYKPGDVVTTMSGKTIEIVNTDAEGRVILSDALHYAHRYEPSAVVELSTLTGGCIIAVGHHAIAGMGNSDDLLGALRTAGDSVNERVWPMPFFDEYGEMVKSKVADLRNSAGRVASSVTAGKFLEAFVGDHPWVHLDIASTAYHDGSTPRLNEEYCPEQATGIGVRLLVEWLRNYKAPAWKPKPKPEPSKPRTPPEGPKLAKGPARIGVS